MTTLAHKQEALRWARLKIVAGGQSRYWRGVEARLKAEIATLLAQVGTHPQGGDSLEAPAPLSDAVA